MGNAMDMGGNRRREIPGHSGRAPGLETPSRGGEILNRNQLVFPGCDCFEALLKTLKFFPQVITSQARASRLGAGPAASTARRTPCGEQG